MFEQIVDKLPELRRLEDRLEDLEEELAKAQARVAALATKTAEARDADLTREAASLNAGTRPPKPQEPRLREQLESAQRELAVLERRRMLADQERSRYIAQNSERLALLLAEAQATEGARVASRASEALEALLAYYRIEDDARSLARLHPPAEPENSGPAQPSVTVWGNINTRNVTGGPRRGDLESALRYLESLGPATDVGDVDEGAA